MSNPAIHYSPSLASKGASLARYLCIVGSSGAGKSAAVVYLRSLEDTRLEFPKRFTTRPPRPDDNPDENQSISETQFQDYERGNRFITTWKKELAGVGNFWYGIALPTSPDSLSVISGNNSFAKEVILPDSLIIEIYARDELRARRIRERSPQLSLQEIESRIQANDKLSLDEVDIRITNESSLSGLERAVQEVLHHSMSGRP